MKEECVRLLSGAPDAATQLVQLPEPESLGIFDHERVDGRHVDAALDDGGAHEHVELASQKSITVRSSTVSSIWPCA